VQDRAKLEKEKWLPISFRRHQIGQLDSSPRQALTEGWTTLAQCRTYRATGRRDWPDLRRPSCDSALTRQGSIKVPSNCQKWA